MTHTTKPGRLHWRACLLAALLSAAALAVLSRPAATEASSSSTTFSFRASAAFATTAAGAQVIQVKANGTSRSYGCNVAYSSCYRPIMIRIRLLGKFERGIWELVAKRDKTVGGYAWAGVTELFGLIPCDELPEGLTIPFVVETTGTALTTGKQLTYRTSLRYASCA
jgi:hypothetical protein